MAQDSVGTMVAVMSLSSKTRWCPALASDRTGTGNPFREAAGLWAGSGSMEGVGGFSSGESGVSVWEEAGPGQR